MSTEKAVRYLDRKIELRAAKDGSNSPGTVVGYAAVYNSASQDLGGFRETIAPGAFKRCLSDDVRCLWNHRDEAILGRSSAGTLRLEEDGIGLRYECDLPDTSVGRDVAEGLRRGDITGSSFQFTIDPDGEDWDWSGPVPLRCLRSISRLYDVSPVTFPAYEDSSCELRSYSDAADAFKSQLDSRLSRLRARLALAEATA